MDIHDQIVQQLCDWMSVSSDRQKNLEAASLTAICRNVIEMDDIHCLSDWYNFLDSLQLWVLRGSVNANEISNLFSKSSHLFSINLPSSILPLPESSHSNLL
ncbi:hypothetical protein N7G274_009192 [Stereocaulon virgatum]|uniref:Uncharacterized protein n=1 Tax=Stereocaulon virgatum TaxID=373712 RepID=A0ABR4A3R0_9LECA